MVQPKNNVYRGCLITKFGRGKKVVFQTIINDREWSSMIESDLKTAIDAWIDEGIEPYNPREGKMIG
jgi:hypothetical protein